MREFSSRNPRQLIPVPPDTVAVAVVSSAGAVVAQDWPTGAEIVAFGSTQNFWLDMGSTSVAIPAASTAGSTAAPSELLRDGTFYQIPGDSTGYSLTAGAAATISLSFWKRS